MDSKEVITVLKRYINNKFTNTNLILKSIDSKLNNLICYMDQTKGVVDSNEKKIKTLNTYLYKAMRNLHTLIEKIKEEHLSKIRLDILKNIYAICCNLPCPECSQHAKTYLNNLNFNAIRTKNDFKNMIYTFHNSVNIKKGKPLFNRNDLDSKYENNVLTTTFYNFLVKFKDKHASNRFIHEDLYRSKLSSSIVSWFKENQEYFDE